jgi:hypothetical protein
VAVSFSEHVDRFEKRLEPVARYLDATGACTSLLMVVLVPAHVIAGLSSASPWWGRWSSKSYWDGKKMKKVQNLSPVYERSI